MEARGRGGGGVIVFVFARIISSMYKTENNTSFVWKGHRPTSVCNCHGVKERLMGNMLQANLRARGKFEQRLGPCL